tara:strand:+ start:216 stop:785 length:570 start_codon:yes stop_codon:yes gene_type:complete
MVQLMSTGNDNTVMRDMSMSEVRPQTPSGAEGNQSNQEEMPNSMVTAIHKFSDLMEEKREALGWNDETYKEIFEAGMNLHKARNVLYVSNDTLDKSLGKHLVDELTKALWAENAEDEDAPPHALTRPFSIEFHDEDDVSTFARNVIYAFRRDLQRYVLETERKRVREQMTASPVAQRRRTAAFAPRRDV